MKITPLRGIPIGSGPSEDRFLEGWLNDDWDKLPAEWSLAIGTTLSEVSERQDNSARKAIIEKFLPTLRAADQNRAQIILPGGMTKAAVHTRMETALRIGRTFLPLQEKLAGYPMVQWTMDPYLSSTALLACGRNPIESWAAHALFNMAKVERLHRLRTCLAEGCNRYFIAKRSDGKFCSGICRVKHHQSDPAFKEKHREQAKKTYHEKKERLQRGRTYGKA